MYIYVFCSLFITDVNVDEKNHQNDVTVAIKKPSNFNGSAIFFIIISSTIISRSFDVV